MRSTCLVLAAILAACTPPTGGDDTDAPGDTDAPDTDVTETDDDTTVDEPTDDVDTDVEPDTDDVETDVVDTDALDTDVADTDVGDTDDPLIDTDPPFIGQTSELAMTNRSFEDDVLAAGGWSETTPTGWTMDDAGCTVGVFRPTTGAMTSAEPLASPATGAQAVAFVCPGGPVDGSLRMDTGVPIAPLYTYAASVAVGRRSDVATPLDHVAIELGYDTGAGFVTMSSTTIDVGDITSGAFERISTTWNTNGASPAQGYAVLVRVRGIRDNGAGGSQTQALVDAVQFTQTTRAPWLYYGIAPQNQSFEEPELASAGDLAGYDSNDWQSHGWVPYSNNCYIDVLRPPATAFTATAPLAPPATGAQAAVIYCPQGHSNYYGMLSYTPVDPIQPGLEYSAHVAVGVRADVSPLTDVSITLYHVADGGPTTTLGTTTRALHGAGAPASGRFTTLSVSGTPPSAGRLKIELLATGTAAGFMQQIVLDNVRITAPSPTP